MELSESRIQGDPKKEYKIIQKGNTGDPKTEYMVVHKGNTG